MSNTIWPRQAVSTSEDDDEDHGHATKLSIPPTPKKNRQSLEYLRAKVERQLHILERILTTKRQSNAASLISYIRYEGSFQAALSFAKPPPLSVVDRELRHVIAALEKQRELEDRRHQGCALATLSPGKMSTSAPCLTMGSIYRKLCFRFLARRIIMCSPTMHNRRTFITLSKDDTIEDDNTVGEWISETCAERYRRVLQRLGIDMEHKPRKWAESQDRYGCFRPSYLRWSWTVVENGVW